MNETTHTTLNELYSDFLDRNPGVHSPDTFWEYVQKERPNAKFQYRDVLAFCQTIVSGEWRPRR